MGADDPRDQAKPRRGDSSRGALEVDEGRPPFFASWTGMYVLVLSVLAVQVAIYWALTRMFE